MLYLTWRDGGEREGKRGAAQRNKCLFAIFDRGLVKLAGIELLIVMIVVWFYGAVILCGIGIYWHMCKSCHSLSPI